MGKEKEPNDTQEDNGLRVQNGPTGNEVGDDKNYTLDTSTTDTPGFEPLDYTVEQINDMYKIGNSGLTITLPLEYDEPSLIQDFMPNGYTGIPSLRIKGDRDLIKKFTTLYKGGLYKFLEFYQTDNYLSENYKTIVGKTHKGMIDFRSNLLGPHFTYDENPNDSGQYIYSINIETLIQDTEIMNKLKEACEVSLTQNYDMSSREHPYFRRIRNSRSRN